MSSFFTLPNTQRKRRLSGAPERPRKRPTLSKPPAKSAPKYKPTDTIKLRPKIDDDSISGSESSDESIASIQDSSDVEEGSETGDEGETAAEKRLRLAERYLENVRGEINEVGFDAAEVDRDLLAERLQEDVAETKGKVYRRLAQDLAFENASHTFFKADAKGTTSVAVRAPFAYLTTKDMAIQKWRIQETASNQYPKATKRNPKKQAPPRKRPELVSWIRGSYQKGHDRDYKRHVKPILTVAISSDGKYLVTGGVDKRLIIYDAESLRPLKVFTQHRDAVTGVSFRRGTNQLYSCSKDRTVKVWSLDELAYVETLFGHQDEIVDIDALAQEKCVSVGARDRTARLWKVADETQLVYRASGAVDKKSKDRAGTKSLTQAGEGAMERVAMIDDDLFVTGSDDGTIALWSVQKKKPLFLVPLAHGVDSPPPFDKNTSLETEALSPKITRTPMPRWITALRTIPYSDVVFSGSWDGSIRVWKLSDDKKQIVPAGVLGGGETVADVNDNNTSHHSHTGHSDTWKIPGVVNDIDFFERGEKCKEGLCVVAAIAKEHRFGRWLKLDSAKNGGVVFEVPRTPSGSSSRDIIR